MRVAARFSFESSLAAPCPKRHHSFVVFAAQLIGKGKERAVEDGAVVAGEFI